MHSFAQTNIQLVNQLQRDGYHPSEIEFVVRSYELAMKLFTGLFRACGKTFIAHLVGTASILGKHRAPLNLVVAGLLHAAYTAGDFGDGKKGITNDKRDWLSKVVGKEIEAYISGYTELHWSDKTVPEIYARFEHFDSKERDIILIRLANELEEFLDFGILYSGVEKRRHYNYIDGVGKIMLIMAEKLGYPALAKEIEKEFLEVMKVDIPPSIRLTDGRDFSFLIAPQSYQRVMDVVAKRLGTTDKR